MRVNGIFALVPMAIVAVVYGLSAADQPADPAVELSRAKSFAFGGVGAAGIVTRNEILFHQVLATPEALVIMRGLLTHGTAEAKLYALCGIRVLDPASFAGASEPLKKENPSVETVSGCMIMKQPAASVITGILAGNYDFYWHRQ